MRNGFIFLLLGLAPAFAHAPEKLNPGDESGYYLLGYKPALHTFQIVNHRRAFHKIKVRVKGKRLHIRSRTGFYGFPDAESPPPSNTRSDQLKVALSSPFACASVRVDLASVFLNDTQTGPMVRSFLHIDGRDLSFHDEPDGSKKLTFDVMAVTFGDNGMVVDGTGNTYTGSLKKPGYEAVLKNGVDYALNVPVKAPSAYQVRVAVRDVASTKVGSARQFIIVPDLHLRRLVESGIILNVTAEGSSGPAVRRFHPGEQVTYSVQIYHAELDSATHAPALEVQFRIFHEGRQVYATDPKPVNLRAQSDFKAIAVGGHIKLGPAMEPGDYALEVAVTDKLAIKQKYSVATQWIDFEVPKASENTALAVPEEPTMPQSPQP